MEGLKILASFDGGVFNEEMTLWTVSGASLAWAVSKRAMPRSAPCICAKTFSNAAVSWICWGLQTRATFFSKPR